MTANRRADALIKVTGSATYAEDLPFPPDCLHLATIRSTVPHADLLAVDATEARAMAGVHAVITGQDPGPVDPTIRVTEYSTIGFDYVEEAEQRLLATDRVRFDGELIGVVVADSPEQALLAADSVNVTYRNRQPFLHFSDAMQPDAEPMHGGLATNVACEDSLEWGNVEKALGEADVVIERSFYGGNVSHHPMERTLPFIIDCTADMKQVHAPVANPWMTASHVATALGLPMDRVSVRVPMIGGGFGAKQATTALVVAACLSETFKRPIRHIPTAKEAFRTTSRHGAEYRIRIGASRQGELLAGDAQVTMDTGAYFTGAAVVLHNAIISAWGAYRWPSFRARGQAIFTNKVPSGSFRATGKNQTTFGIESAIDCVAQKLGVDPVEFRKQNCLKPGEKPTARWSVRGIPHDTGVPPLDCDIAEMIDAGIRALQDSSATEDDTVFAPEAAPRRTVRGRGYAVSFRHASQHGGTAEARVHVRSDGTLLVEHNASEVGGGEHHVIATVCAREFAVSTAEVDVAAPDTSNGLRFSGVTAQRTTVQIGMAALDACRTAQVRIVERAGRELGHHGRGSWHWAPGKGLSDGSNVYDLKALGTLFSDGVETVVADGRYHSRASTPDAAFGAIEGWTPGVGIAEIEVDCLTGEVSLVRYCAVAQAGKVIHLPSARGQIAGGAIMGMGIALREDLRHGPDGLETDDAFTYAIPRMSTLPDTFEVVLLEDRRGHGPFGARPIAQTSLPCVSPAIANAIQDAAGVRLTETPMTAERVLKALDELDDGRPASEDA